MEEYYVYIWKLHDFDVEKFEFSIPTEKLKLGNKILEKFYIPAGA